MDPEKIAALLDNRLEPAERARLIEQLTDSPELVEILADAAAVQEPLDVKSETSRIAAPAIRRKLGWRSMALAAGLVLAISIPIECSAARTNSARIHSRRSLYSQSQASASHQAGIPLRGRVPEALHRVSRRPHVRSDLERGWRISNWRRVQATHPASHWPRRSRRCSTMCLGQHLSLPLIAALPTVRVAKIPCTPTLEWRR